MTEASDWAVETEERLLDAALAHAPAMGWTRLTALAAGRDIGLTAPETELLIPHGGADLAALFSRRCDRRALEALAEVDPQSLKIRERIRRGVEAWLDVAAKDEPAVRRWAGFLSLPLHLPLAGRLVWASADALWRWAGDTATDENHYSKRAILAGILVSALPMRLAHGREAALTYLDARIENVMAYERWKASFKPGDLLTELAAALGRLRYGATKAGLPG
jgi:ubiquinone biosynthesis protein COQ9